MKDELRTLNVYDDREVLVEKIDFKDISEIREYLKDTYDIKLIGDIVVNSYDISIHTNCTVIGPINTQGSMCAYKTITVWNLKNRTTMADILTTDYVLGDNTDESHVNALRYIGKYTDTMIPRYEDRVFFMESFRYIFNTDKEDNDMYIEYILCLLNTFIVHIDKQTHLGIYLLFNQVSLIDYLLIIFSKLDIPYEDNEMLKYDDYMEILQASQSSKVTLLEKLGSIEILRFRTLLLMEAMVGKHLFVTTDDRMLDTLRVINKL